MGPDTQINEPITFLIDWRKIETVEDIKKIFKYMTLQFTPSSEKDLVEMKHLIVPTNMEQDFIEENFQNDKANTSK